MKIFVVHYKKLTERKKYLADALQYFAERNKLEFIEDYDRDFISEYDTMYHKNKDLWIKRVNGLYRDEPGYRDLKNSEICNSLSHLDAMKRIVDQKLNRAIIIEDDVIINNNFIHNIDKFERELENQSEKFDFAFFGSSFSINILDNANLSESVKVDINTYKKIPGKTRTVDAYIVTYDAAKKILDNIKEIVLPFDFELNYFFKELNMNVYWYDPGFISQGSMTGNYSSSIR